MTVTSGTRRRRRAFCVAAAALVVASCSTVPPPDPPVPSSDRWRVESFLEYPTPGGRIPVRITAIVVDPAPTPTETELRVLRAGDETNPAALVVGVTPWRRNGLLSRPRRLPVGVVQDDAVQIAPPREPYWALVQRSGGLWDMVPQAEMALEAENAETAPQGSARTGAAVGAVDLHLAAGAFYPLIQGGRPVATDFPGAGIRAARTAIAAGTVSEGARSRQVLLIVTATGSRPGPGRGRSGLTTAEFAAALAARYDLDWALNLDGGRSAWVRPPGAHGDRAVLPRGPVARRPGPVRLEFSFGAAGVLQ